MKWLTIAVNTILIKTNVSLGIYLEKSSQLHISVVGRPIWSGLYSKDQVRRSRFDSGPVKSPMSVLFRQLQKRV